jgi:hypothetical protein
MIAALTSINHLFRSHRLFYLVFRGSQFLFEFSHVLGYDIIKDLFA